jgi:hypothetical protein
MPILLSDRELDAMDGLPHFHRCLYIFGIRRYMDYQTGISGIKRKISYKSLSEEIYVTPHQGVADTKTKSVAQLKRAVKALEKVGLVTIHSKVTKTEKQLILKCVLAPSGKSVQKKPVPNPYHSPILQAVPVSKEENTLNTDTSDNSEQKTDTESRTTQNKKPVPHQISDKLNNNIRQQFLDLLSTKRFPVAYLADARTNHMLDLWEEANLTLTEAQAAIKHGDNEVLSRQGRVTVPWYYQDIPFQLRNDLNHSEEANYEINRPTTQQPVKRLTHEQRRRRMAEWAEKKERELEEEGSESDNLAV